MPLKRLIVEARNLLFFPKKRRFRQTLQMTGFLVFLINLSGMTILFQGWFFLNMIMMIEGLFTGYVRAISG
ncbi:MAG: hypothetical protein WAW41_07560 [Methylobacter sp.]